MTAHSPAARCGWRLLADHQQGHSDQIDLCAGVVGSAGERACWHQGHGGAPNE